MIEQSKDSHEVLGDKPTYSGESTKNTENIKFKSAYDDSTIHVVNSGNINLKTNNEQSSSSKSGKNKIVRIKGSDELKNPKEKEYYDFSMQVYNMDNGETIFRLERNSIYPRISATEGVHTKFLYMLF